MSAMHIQIVVEYLFLIGSLAALAYVFLDIFNGER